MRSIFAVLFLTCSTPFLMGQDSLFVRNHYALGDIHEKCKGHQNQIECLEEQIQILQSNDYSGKNYTYEVIKNRKALFICHINEYWIYRLRGDFEKGQQQLDLANRYIDSLKLWDSFGEDIEDILRNVKFAEKEWCFRTYRQDTAAFYACNCQRFFSELNEETDTTAVEKILVDSIPTPIEKTYRYGQIISNDTLIIAPEFVLDSTSSAYFEKYQSFILAEFRKIRFPEILREQSVLVPPERDTLIIKIQLTSNQSEQIKKCSVAKTSNFELADNCFRNAFMNTDFYFPSGTLVFYIPLVLAPVEHSVCCNLDKIHSGSNHFLIQYEKARPAQHDTTNPN